MAEGGSGRQVTAPPRPSRPPSILTQVRGIPDGEWVKATRYVGLPWKARGGLRRLLDVAEALRLFLSARRGDVVLAYCGAGSSLWLGFLRSLFGRRGATVIFWGCHWYEGGRLRRGFMRRACRGADILAVWSRRQIETYGAAFGIPPEKFAVVPYKANFSKYQETPLPWSGYLFSGGNSDRDYATLFRALDGTGIPTLVSRTRPGLTNGLACPENVVIVAAVEPHYRRLMAGSEMVVLTVQPGLIRGVGEQTILNAMWYGKPVIAAEDVTACDYIEEGVTGYVVPAGEAEALRAAVLRLWNDPDLRRRMGEEARRRAQAHYTHAHWLGRLLELARAHLGA